MGLNDKYTILDSIKLLNGIQYYQSCHPFGLPRVEGTILWWSHSWLGYCNMSSCKSVHLKFSMVTEYSGQASIFGNPLLQSYGILTGCYTSSQSNAMVQFKSWLLLIKHHIVHSQITSKIALVNMIMASLRRRGFTEGALKSILKTNMGQEAVILFCSIVDCFPYRCF